MNGEPSGVRATPQQTARPTVKDDCQHALNQVYAFLDHELDAQSAQVIREHLAACEPCVDSYDLELMVKSLVRRSCGGELAPAELRSRIILSLTTIRRDL